MDTKFNFKSAVCTSRVQSERLLALGLKPETADMSWIISYHCECFVGNPEELYTPDEDGCDDIYIPSWSLHRLIEMCPDYIEENYFGVSAVDVSYYFGLCEGCIGYKFVREGGNLYDNIIDCIEWLIKEGYFPKEYLV